MNRTGIVLIVGRMGYPPADHQEVLRVITDHQPACEGAFYLRPDSPEPEVGQPITYGDAHADYVVAGRAVKARKVGYNFDPDEPLR